MAETFFRLALATVTSAPPEPPMYTWPTVEGADQTVVYPEPTKRNGLGYPTGIYGKPAVEFGRRTITLAGLQWYAQALYPDGIAKASYDVKVVLWDPRKLDWVLFKGICWHPHVGKALPPTPDGMRWADFRVRITELSPIADWSTS